MNKIKKLFSGMINAVKETLERFPITTIIVFILTLIIAFFVIDTDFSKEVDELIEHIVFIGSYTAIGSWFVEALLENKKDIRRIIGYVVSFVIAFVIDRIIKSYFVSEEILARWVCEYAILGFLGTIYILVRRSKVKFEKYILNLFLNFKRVSIIFGIISIGFLILYAIFTVLILDSLSFSVVTKILCLFAGFYYIPVVLNSFTDKEAEDTKFNKAVFSRVLLPLIGLAMAIVYIYIVKILFITEVPKNELFSILSMIFVCAFPVYVINKNYGEKDTFLYKVNKLIPYLYIPFIFLQIYAMGIRINSYGLTDSRYMGVVLIVYEIMAIGLAVTKNSAHLKEIIPATIVISVIVTITPFNFDTLPKLSQKSIVDRYVANGVEFDNLSEDDKRKFAGAYQYIEYDEEYINPSLTQIEKEKLSSYNTYRYSYDTTDDNEESKKISVYVDRKLDNVDISKYSRISELDYLYNDGPVLETNEDVEFRVDLKDFAMQMIEAQKISDATLDRVFEESPVIEINDKVDLFLTDFSIRYEVSTDSIEYVRIEGYLLQK